MRYHLPLHRAAGGVAETERVFVKDISKYLSLSFFRVRRGRVELVIDEE